MTIRHVVLSFLMAVSLIAAGTSAWLLKPEEPQLTGDTTKQEEIAHPYTPTTDCKPAALVSIASKSERESKADACRDAKEQHRQRTSEIVQQRRSADSADASAIAAYEQARIAAWGTIIGVATLGAAIAAAFFAYEAAKAAVEGLRPWVDVDVEPEWTLTYANEIWISARVKLKNTGSSPARNIKIGWSGDQGPPQHDSAIQEFHDTKPDWHDVVKSGLLPNSGFEEQQIWQMPWGAETKVDPAKGFTPFLGLSVSYDLPSGGQGLTVRWFWIGAAREPKQPTRIKGRLRHVWDALHGRTDQSLSDEGAMDPLRFVAEGRGQRKLIATPAGYGRVE